LEQRHAERGIRLTPERIAFIEKQNPCFRERHVESSRPRELLSQDTFYVGRLKGVGKVYLHAVVDTYGSYAFGFLHTSKQAEAAVAVMHNDVLPFYASHGLKVGTVLTDNGTEFCRRPEHPYELYLDLNDIEHRRTKVNQQPGHRQQPAECGAVIQWIDPYPGSSGGTVRNGPDRPIPRTAAHGRHDVAGYLSAGRFGPSTGNSFLPIHSRSRPEWIDDRLPGGSLIFKA